MYCLSLAYWENVAIAIVVIIAVVALLRLLIAALGGSSAWWPPVVSPWAAGSPAGPLGFLAAALNIFIWAVIMIAIIVFIFSLIGCLLGAVGGFRLWPRADFLSPAYAASCHLQGLLT